MVYQIKNYSFDKARREGVVIFPSTNKLKKIDVFKNGRKVASIGGIRKNGIPYNDYPTYKKTIGRTKADKKRQAYLKRHAHEKDIKNKEYTPSYYAKKILW